MLSCLFVFSRNFTTVAAFYLLKDDKSCQVPGLWFQFCNAKYLRNKFRTHLDVIDNHQMYKNKTWPWPDIMQCETQKVDLRKRKMKKLRTNICFEWCWFWCSWCSWCNSSLRQSDLANIMLCSPTSISDGIIYQEIDGALEFQNFVSSAAPPHITIML